MLADFTRRVSRRTPETLASQGIGRFGSRIQGYVKAGIHASDWGGDSMCFEGIGHEQG